MDEVQEIDRMTVEGMEAMAGNTDTTPLTFYQSNKMSPKCLFCFVEGKNDTDYYQPKIKSLYGDNYLFIKCNYKKFVLSMYDQIYASDHLAHKLAFFVDKDFDESISRPGLYETECYSIENYYVYPSAFSEFLQYCIRIGKDTPEYNKAMTYYNQEFEKFHVASLQLNAWIAQCRNKDRCNEMVHLDSLGDSYPSAFFDITFGSEYIQQYNLSVLNSHFKANPAITQDELDKKTDELKNTNYFKSFRGKYELHYLYRMLVDLRAKASRKRKDQDLILDKVPWDFNYPNFMIYYCAYSYFPESLRQFILSYC